MTGRTDNRGYSFPECDPPLVKDRSDIIFMRDLATQVDADATALDARIIELIEKPDTARIAYAGSLQVTKSTAGNAILTIPYASTTYATPGAFADLAAGGLRVQARGFYLVNSYVRCNNAGVADMQVRNLRNGLARTEGRRFEGPAYPVASASESSMQTMDLMVASVGDLLRTQIKLSPADGLYSFEARMAAHLVLQLDV